MSEKLNLGCGSVIRPGWHNLDLQPARGGIVCDLTKRLPYADGSVDLIHTEHFIEHLTWMQASNLLNECYRVLKPGGLLRISTPDLRVLAMNYLNSNISAYELTGWKPMSPCDMMNEGMREWGHLYLWDYPEMHETLSCIGFTEIHRHKHRQSLHQECENLEIRPDCDDLIVECQK